MGADLKRRAQPWLGTLVEVAVPVSHTDSHALAFEAVARVHRLMSFHAEDSDLARLRRSPPGQWICVDPLTVRVLTEARRIHALSKGLFDVTIGRELVAWGYLPRPPGLDLRLYRDGTMDDLEIGNEIHVRCNRPLLIDLGGIAKGFAVDCAVAALQEAGVPYGLANAGGDLRVFGDLAAPIRFRAPDWSGLAGALSLRESAIASSSNMHARRRTSNKERSPHVGPDGEALLTERLITVEAPEAMIADALTKVAMANSETGEQVAAALGARIVAVPARELSRP